MSLHPLTAKVIDDLAASMQAAAERMKEKDARIAELERALDSQTFVIAGEPFTSCSVRALEVLKAMRALPAAALVMATGGWGEVAKAELARREAEEP